MLVVAFLEFERRARTVAAIERGQRFYVDRGADAIAVHVRRQRLVDFDARQELRGNHIECDLPRIALGRRNAHAADADRVEVRIDAAHDDEASFALVARDRDRGHALDRFGHVLIGKLADRVGRDDIFEVVGVALLAQRRGLTRGVADDEYVVELVNVRADRERDRCVGVADVDRLRRGRGADVDRGQRVAARRHAVDAETAVAVGDRGAAELVDAHLGALEADFAARIGNAARKRRGGRGKCRERGENGEHDTTYARRSRTGRHFMSFPKRLSAGDDLQDS